MNLLELPVLFYAACIIICVTSTTTGVLIALAWLYVGLRFVHSAIHLTSNQVMYRLYAFAASNTTLLVIWVLAAVSLAQKSGA